MRGNRNVLPYFQSLWRPWFCFFGRHPGLKKKENEEISTWSQTLVDTNHRMEYLGTGYWAIHWSLKNINLLKMSPSGFCFFQSILQYFLWIFEWLRTVKGYHFSFIQSTGLFFLLPSCLYPSSSSFQHLFPIKWILLLNNANFIPVRYINTNTSVYLVSSF